MLSHSWRWYDFSKIQIFGLKAHMLSLTTNTVGCFSCNDWLTLFIFQKISAKYLRFNNHSFVSHSFQWKWCSVKKKKKINQASSRFKQPSWISARGISALRILPMSSRGMLKRRAREEQDLIKLITLTAWSRIFLSASEFFFWLRAHGHEEHARRTVWRHWRRLLWGTCSLTHPQSRSQRDKKR